MIETVQNLIDRLLIWKQSELDGSTLLALAYLSEIKKNNRKLHRFFESLQDMEVQDSTPRADSSEEPKEPARLSPNSLERRFLAELHQLDSMEMSMKQLTGVERTRAVSMAQQETVSLAQMLKV